MFRSMNETWQIVYTGWKTSPEVLFLTVLYLKNALVLYYFWLILERKDGYINIKNVNWLDMTY